MTRLIITLVILLVAGTACDLVGVRGSGNVITESRDVSGFSEIVLEGSGRVEVAVTGEESLTIEAEDNLMPLLTSEVNEGVLELGAAEALAPTEEIVYTITVANLEAVSVGGSGEVTAPGIEAEVFDLTVSGSGYVSFADFAADELVVRISGSGDAEVSGTSDHLELDVSGSGSFLGEDLSTATTDAEVSSSGDVLVNVSQYLMASVSGSGNIIYSGNPASVDTSVSGSGEIEED